MRVLLEACYCGCLLSLLLRGSDEVDDGGDGDCDDGGDWCACISLALLLVLSGSTRRCLLMEDEVGMGNEEEEVQPSQPS